jgi:hypothetical protein
VAVAATMTEMPKKQSKGSFVDEMRAVAMKLHTRDQAKEGEKEAESPPVAKWEPSIDGYLRFLVDSKLVYDTLEAIVQKAPHTSCMFLDFIVYPHVFERYCMGVYPGYQVWGTKILLAYCRFLFR